MKFPGNETEMCTARNAYQEVDPQNVRYFREKPLTAGITINFSTFDT